KLNDIPGLRRFVKALEEGRRADLEDWMKDEGLSGLVFPANADIARSDIETNEESYQDGIRDGTLCSNMNGMMRLLGLPSVSVCMGMMSDTSMPINLTFVGGAYSDRTLLRFAYHYELLTRYRVAPARTPELTGDII